MTFNEKKFFLWVCGITELKSRFKNRVTDYDVIKQSKVKTWDVIANFFTRILKNEKMKINKNKLHNSEILLTIYYPSHLTQGFCFRYYFKSSELCNSEFFFFFFSLNVPPTPY